MAGEPDTVDQLRQGRETAGNRLRIDIDGYSLLPYLTDVESMSPRNGSSYFSDDGDLVGQRLDDWKVMFMEQPTGARWASEPFVTQRLPKLYDLRIDRFERRRHVQLL